MMASAKGNWHKIELLPLGIDPDLFVPGSAPPSDPSTF